MNIHRSNHREEVTALDAEVPLLHTSLIHFNGSNGDCSTLKQNVSKRVTLLGCTWLE